MKALARRIGVPNQAARRTASPPQADSLPHIRLGALLAAFCLASAAAPPELKPIDEAGFRQVLQADRGKVVLFDFWATWCDPCREELPVLVKLAAKYRDRGLVLVTVSADSPGTEGAARQFLEKNAVAPPAFIKHVKNDEDFINSIDVKWSGALPALFLYDRAGARAASFFGETETSDIEAAIQKLLP